MVKQKILLAFQYPSCLSDVCKVYAILCWQAQKAAVILKTEITACCLKGRQYKRRKVCYCQSFLCFLSLQLPDREKEWIKSIWITFVLSRVMWMGREGNYSFPRTCKLGSNNYKKSFKSTIMRSSKWPEHEMTSHGSAHLRDLLPGSLSDLEKREQFWCRYYHLQEQMLSADTCCQSSHVCYSSAMRIPSLSCCTSKCPD